MKVFGGYGNYAFTRGHDPALDGMRTAWQDSGLSLKKISEITGISTSTLYNWNKLKTRRPQFASVMSFYRALGYDLQIVKPARPVTAKGIKVARNVASKADVHQRMQ